MVAGWRNPWHVATVDLMSKGFNWRAVVPSVDSWFGPLFCGGLIRSGIACPSLIILIGWPKGWSTWQMASHCWPSWLQ